MSYVVVASSRVSTRATNEPAMSVVSARGAVTWARMVNRADGESGSGTSVRARIGWHWL